MGLGVLGGADPWSAADPLVGLFALPVNIEDSARKGDQGVARGLGGPPHYLV